MRRRPVFLSVVIAIVLAGALTAVGVAGGPAGGSGKVSALGAVGALRLDASTEQQLLAFAGPTKYQVGFSVEPGTGTAVFGYSCALKPGGRAGLSTYAVGKTLCRTVFFMDLAADVKGTLVPQKLRTFFTSSPAYEEAHGVKVGMTTAQAQQLTGAKVVGACGGVIRVSTPKASVTIGVHSGRVYAIVAHSPHHDVSAFPCL